LTKKAMTLKKFDFYLQKLKIELFEK